MPTAIERINRARSEGLDITADMYPYIGAGTGLTSVLPPWADADNQLYQNLRNPEIRAKIRTEALHPSGDWEAMVALMGADNVMPVGFLQPENRKRNSQFGLRRSY